MPGSGYRRSSSRQLAPKSSRSCFTALTAATPPPAVTCGSVGFAFVVARFLNGRLSLVFCSGRPSGRFVAHILFGGCAAVARGFLCLCRGCFPMPSPDSTHERAARFSPQCSAGFYAGALARPRFNLSPRSVGVSVVEPAYAVISGRPRFL
jgi:hypothetical protein